MEASSAGAGVPPQAPTTEETWPLGVSRPPLGVDDLPEPEEVFHAPRIGRKELVTLVLGPSLIALGLSIGSGEWLLAPLAIGQGGSNRLRPWWCVVAASGDITLQRHSPARPVRA